MKGTNSSKIVFDVVYVCLVYICVCTNFVDVTRERVYAYL